MTPIEKIKAAQDAMIEVVKDYRQAIGRVDEFCDWHIPVQDLNFDDESIDACFFDLKDPTIADRIFYQFLKQIPEWMRYAVNDMYDEGVDQ